MNNTLAVFLCAMLFVVLADYIRIRWRYRNWIRYYDVEELGDE